MRYIEPHGHMVSRVTDDYMDMVTAGCQAVCEPAFWAGFDRSSADVLFVLFCFLYFV
jgi:predicted metal-dependent TIM-barrel fold hydrolase